MKPCAWCGPRPQEPGVSHGICDACIAEHFPGLLEPQTSRRRVLVGKLARGFAELRGRAASGLTRVLRSGGPAAW